MPLFCCDNCGIIDNTALTRYWLRGDSPALCSACDPKGETKGWHGRFPARNPTEWGYVRKADGFWGKPVESEPSEGE